MKTKKLLRGLILAALLLAGGYYGLQWMRANPQHVWFAPLKLSHPIGMATGDKLAALSDDFSQCQAILREGGVEFKTLPPRGEGSCRADQQVRLGQQKGFPVAFKPANVAPSCPVSTALVLWQHNVVAPAAQAHFGRKVVTLHNLGSYNCRNVANTSYRSEHATGNAIDISAFTLEGGQTISVLKDWKDGTPAERTFLRQVRDGGCELFATVLSPDYNLAHADHFHLDMAQRTAGYSMCR